MNHQEVPQDLQIFLSKLSKVKRKYFVLGIFLSFLSFFLYGLTVSLCLSMLMPESTGIALSFGLLAFLVLFIFKTQWKMQKPMQSSLLLALDMKDRDSKSSIYNEANWESLQFQGEWGKDLEAFQKELKQTEILRMRTLLIRVLPVLALTVLFSLWNGGVFYNRSLFLVQSLTQTGAKIRVVEGGGALKKNKIYLKKSKLLKIGLLKTNLLEVEVSGKVYAETPVVEIRKNEKESVLLQSFQMSEVKEQGLPVYRIQFSIAESSFLYIPQYAGEIALAEFIVQAPDLPQVTLTSLSSLAQGTWQDDKPLDLHLKVWSKHPLRAVNLLIDIGDHHFKEIVYSSGSEDSLTLETDTTLYLNKYIDRDFEKVEIVAEAVDQSIPTPLVGYSHPIVLQTISSYGQYKKTLQTLKNVKENVDAAISKSDPKLSAENNDLMTNIQKETMTSPFFDSIDRNRLSKLKEAIKNNSEAPDIKNVYQISQNLNAFLQEHEMLDDRERDRDFFVAARGLSHLLADETSLAANVQMSEKKMQSFLFEREKRWETRIKRLQHPEVLKHAKNIVVDHHFTKEFSKLENESHRKNALRILSESVSYYRQWIDELEAQEDKEREEREKGRQSGMMSAREDLKKLQMRQLEVAKRLHSADTRGQDDLKSDWQIARMHQNTNIHDAKALEDKLNSLAPRSADRLSAAIEAMKLTLQNGESSEFSQSESFADLASRLLHQTAKMTEQEQKNMRRVNRNSSDTKYYGQSVVGGDIEIEHEYKVDPRYREDVLDEVIKSNYDGENRVILNNFLKRIIR